MPALDDAGDPVHGADGVASGEGQGSTWDQFDVEAANWVKPAEAMKIDRAHRVPLSRQALDVLAEARKGNPGAQAFPGSRRGAMLGNSVMSHSLRTAGTAASGTSFDRASRTGRGSTRWSNYCGGLGDGGGLRSRQPARQAATGHAW